MSDSYLDRPQDDNTHRAHPAFKRGKITGVAATLKIIKDIVDGTDTGDGVNVSPPVEAIRRAVLTYKQSLTTKEDKKALQSAKDIVAKVIL